MHKITDLTGVRFGRLQVLNRTSHINGMRVRWDVVCDCGIRKSVSKHTLLQGASKSCGCLQRELTISRSRKLPFEGIYNLLCRSAKVRGVSVNLTYAEYVQFTEYKTCHYCHYDLLWVPITSTDGAKSHNLDRIDNDLGYSTANCLPCCYRCNRGKMHLFTYEEWYEMTRCFRKESCQ